MDEEEVVETEETEETPVHTLDEIYDLVAEILEKITNNL